MDGQIPEDDATICIEDLPRQHRTLHTFLLFPEQDDFRDRLKIWHELEERMLQEQRILTPNTTRIRLSPVDNHEPFYKKVIINTLAVAFIWFYIRINQKLLDNSIGCILNKYDENTQRGPVLPIGNTFNQHKRMKTAERVSSFVIATIGLLWIFFDICSQSSMIQLLPLHKELAPLFIWFPLVELLGFVLFVLAIGTMILVGAHFTRLHCVMLMCWAILMIVRSVKSLSVLYVSVLGIIVMGWYLLIEKQPPNEGTS